MGTPKQEGYRQPAEWETHDATWVAWPSHGDLWLEQLVPAQGVFVELCRAIADIDPLTGKRRGDSLRVLVPDEKAEQDARRALRPFDPEFYRIPFGDIWLRDIAPIFTRSATGKVAALSFAFNGWGGKYVLAHDDAVSARIAEASGLPTFRFSWVLEGGSVDVDGEGTCLTSTPCLLNPNRTEEPQTTIEARLRDALGVDKILWVSGQLQNDHTDGHIDTIARFVSPGVVVCMQAQDASDPNFEALKTIAQELERSTDAQGRKLEVVRIPSPGGVRNSASELMPASYLNFYIANRTVVIPVYGTPWDDAAVSALTPLFPGRRVVALDALPILEGGGAFHCITQQQPRAIHKR